MKVNKKLISILASIIVAVGALVFFFLPDDQHVYSDSVMNVPAFDGTAYVIINNNQPEFTQDQMTDRSFERYSPLDKLGRCGVAIACIGQDIMPTEERGSIGQVKPSGWHTIKYDFVDGKYLYNRCHLLGYQLTGENANEENLITGTRYLNTEGMLPFENMVAEYVKETGNHVMYRVTPIFDGDNLVARGVQMEALSVEDQGAGVSFNVYIYNNQPGVEIDYHSGESRLQDNQPTTQPGEVTYILNTNNKKFHKSNCGNAGNISEENRKVSALDRQQLLDQGYTPAGCCEP